MSTPSAHAQIVNILKVMKENHWIENAHLAPNDIQKQWTDKSADLTAVLNAGAPPDLMDLNGTTAKLTAKGTPQSAPVPKIIGDQQSSSDIANVNISSVPMSDMSSQPMTKKRSSQSRHGPFANTRSHVPPLTLRTWQTSHDEPLSFYSSTSASSSPPAFKIRRTATGCLPTQSLDYSSISEYEPADYVSQPHPMLSPTSPRYQRSRRNSSQNLSPSSYLSQSPASDGLTNATTLSSVDMSRSNSVGGASMYGGFAMLKVDSQRSESMMNVETATNESLPTGDFQFYSKGISIPATGRPLSYSHAGSMRDSASHPSKSPASNTPNLCLEDLEGTSSMQRTASAESADSVKSRLSRRSQEQVALSARPIAPKDSPEGMSKQASSTSDPALEMNRQISAGGSKVAIQKAKYQRPTHEKIKCDLCALKPDGYRGPHELRRHMDNKHGATRKVWVCVDRSPDQKFLSNCKACKERKTYGAYYNAACHLRRIHWNPREKGKKADKSGKGRGGNGGGDYPSMDCLKLWMEETCVSAASNPLPMEDDQDDEEPDAPVFDVSQDDIDHPCGMGLPRLDNPKASDVNGNDDEFQSHHFLPQACRIPLAEPRVQIANPFQPPPFFTHNDTLTSPEALLTLGNDGSDTGAHAGVLSVPRDIPSACHSYDSDDFLNSESVNHSLALDNPKPADLPYISSISSPLGHLDQYPSLSFESDFPGFSL